MNESVLMLLINKMERHIKQFLVLIGLVVMLIVLFGVFVRYPTTYDSAYFLKQPYVQDVGLLVLLGLGLRFTCLQKLAWSSLGSVYVLTAICALFYVLWNGLWLDVFEQGFNGQVLLTVPNMVDMYRAGAVGIIACAAAAGTVSLLQNMLFVTFLMIGYTLNKVLVEKVLNVTDEGGAITIHLFAGVAGLAYSKIMSSVYTEGHPLNRKSYLNLTYSLIGTLVIFVLYPAFNAGQITGIREQLAFVNTILSLCGAVLMSLAANYYINDRIDPNQFINGAIAGGIVVGSTASFTINPAIAFFEGSVGGAVIGFLTPSLSFDSMGIMTGHLLPGLLGGLYSIIFALGYQLDGYPSFSNNSTFIALSHGWSKQSGLQFAGILVTVLIAGLTSSVVSWLMKKAGFVDSLVEDLVVKEEVVVKKGNGDEDEVLYNVVENRFYDDGVDYELDH